MSRVERKEQKDSSHLPLSDRLEAKVYSKEEIRKLLPIAKNGDFQAQCILGWYYEHQFGPELNIEKALFWYNQAAHQLIFKGNEELCDDKINNYIRNFFPITPKNPENEKFVSSLIILLDSNFYLWKIASKSQILPYLCGMWRDAHCVTQPNNWVKTKNTSSFYHSLTCHLITKDKQALRKSSTPYQDELILLGRLALLALENREIIISTTLLKRVANEYKPSLVDSALSLGCIQKIGDVVIPAEKIIDIPHYFLHTSLQQYLAAYFLFTCLQRSKDDSLYQQAIDFLATEKYNPYYSTVFRFIAGLVSADKTQNRTLRTFWKSLLEAPLDITGLAHLRLIMNCLDESFFDERIPYKDFLLNQIKSAMSYTLKNQLLFRENTDKIELKYLNTMIQEQLFLELQATPNLYAMLETELSDLKNAVFVRKTPNIAMIKPDMHSQPNEDLVNSLLSTLENPYPSDYPSDKMRRSIIQLGEQGKMIPSKDSVLKALVGKLRLSTHLNEYRFTDIAISQALIQIDEKEAVKFVLPVLKECLSLTSDFLTQEYALAAINEVSHPAIIEPLIPAVLDLVIKDSRRRIFWSERSNNANKVIRKIIREAPDTILITLTQHIITFILTILKEDMKSFRSKSLQEEALPWLVSLGDRDIKQVFTAFLLIGVNHFENEIVISNFQEFIKRNITNPIILDYFFSSLKNKDKNSQQSGLEKQVFWSLAHLIPVDIAVISLLKIIHNENGLRPVMAKNFSTFRFKDYTNGSRDHAINYLAVMLEDESLDTKDFPLVLKYADEQMDHKLAIDFFVNLLGNKDNKHYYRLIAITSLARMGEKALTNPGVISALITKIIDEDEFATIRKAVSELYSKLPEDKKGMFGIPNAEDHPDYYRYRVGKFSYSKARSFLPKLCLNMASDLRALRFVTYILIDEAFCRNDELLIRKEAIKTLIQFGKKAVTEEVVAALLKIIQDEDKYHSVVNIIIEEAIPRFAEKIATVPILTELLKHDYVRSFEKLIIYVPNEDVIQICLPFIGKTSTAIDVLGQIGVEAAIPDVITALNNRLKYGAEDFQTFVALKKLNQRINPEVYSVHISKLLSLLRDHDENFQRRGILLLKELAGLREVEAIATKPVINALLKIITQEGGTIAMRIAAIEVLGELDEKAASKIVINTLLRLSNDTSPNCLTLRATCEKVLINMCRKIQNESTLNFIFQKFKALPFFKLIMNSMSKISVLKIYLNSEISCLRFRKQYITMCAQILLQSRGITFGETNIIIYDRNEMATVSIVSYRHKVLCYELCNAFVELGKIFGLPDIFSNAYLNGQNPLVIFEITDSPLTYEPVIFPGSKTQVINDAGLPLEKKIDQIQIQQSRSMPIKTASQSKNYYPNFFNIVKPKPMISSKTISLLTVATAVGFFAGGLPGALIGGIGGGTGKILIENLASCCRKQKQA